MIKSYLNIEDIEFRVLFLQAKFLRRGFINHQLIRNNQLYNLSDLLCYNAVKNIDQTKFKKSTLFKIFNNINKKYDLDLTSNQNNKKMRAYRLILMKDIYKRIKNSILLDPSDNFYSGNSFSSAFIQQIKKVFLQ